MSIRTIVSAWETDGALSVVRREVETTTAARHVVAYPGVQRILSGPWQSAIEENRYRTMKARIDGFIAGDVIVVRMPPSRSAKAQLALLDPPGLAVWEFRTRPENKGNGHRYGVRLFGMFAEKDFFVAMSGVFKEDLLDESEYPKVMTFCKRKWSTHFPSYNPKLGASADAFLSNWLPC